MTLAKELGAVSISGLYMLVAQAIKAQEIWQNITIDDSFTLKVFNDLSAKFKSHSLLLLKTLCKNKRP